MDKEREGKALEIVFEECQPYYGANGGSDIERGLSLKATIIEILNRCNQDFNFPHIDIYLFMLGEEENPDPQYPLNGYCSCGVIDIVFNPHHPDFFEEAKCLVPIFIVHEFAHFARGKLTSDQRSIMADKFVDEGVALAFQKVSYPEIDYPYFDFSPEEIGRILGEAWRIKYEDRNRIENWVERWNYGMHDLPREALHFVGKSWVENYLEGKSLSLKDLVRLETDKVLASLDPSLIGGVKV